MTSFTSLMEKLKQVDSDCERMYVEYTNTKAEYGESQMTSFFREKYENEMQKKQQLKKEIGEAEKQTHNPSTRPNSGKRASSAKPIGGVKRIRQLILSEDDEEDERPVAVRVVGNYKPRKQNVTSYCGIKYRNNVTYRETIKRKNRDRYREKLEMQEFIVN
jgi:hypothetical protein